MFLSFHLLISRSQSLLDPLGGQVHENSKQSALFSLMAWKTSGKILEINIKMQKHRNK